MSAPRVTVLMPVHNVEKHLAAALDSILAQTFTDFELLVIDDCSTDGTAALLDRYTDPRIVRTRNERNLGLVETLNRGIDRARGAYIARMDGDDVCLPDRLAAQVAYLDAHPDTVLVGTKFVHVDDDDGYVFGGMEAPPPPEPGTPGYLRWSLLWMTSIQHPTAMFRRESLGDLRYDADYFTAEDYDLWARLGRVGDVARLPGVHLRYRVNPAGISSTKREQQLETHFQITRRELSALVGEELPEPALRFLFRMVIPQPQDFDGALPWSQVTDALALMQRIRSAFFAQNSLTAAERAHVDREWRRVVRRVVGYLRNSPDASKRRAMRAWMLQYTPGLFARMGWELLIGRLRPSSARGG